MKLLKKIGLILTSFVISMKQLTVKVHGFNIESASDYGIELQPEPSTLSNLMLSKVITIIIVPIILLIGLIVFFIKSKSNILKKLIVSICAITVYIFFVIIMNSIFKIFN